MTQQSHAHDGGSDQAHNGNHTHNGHTHNGHAHNDEAGLADLLILDAEVLDAYLGEVIEWVALRAPDDVRTIIDVGAGPGTGSFALARRFTAAEVVAVDKSPLMLESLRTAALERGLANRLRVVQADLDVVWPEVGTADIVWAASSLHEVADPERVFRDIYSALNPGGLLVVIEMDAPPRFLPDNIGQGRPGLESRCHEVVARTGGNSHPNWGRQLEEAGFESIEERSFSTEVSPTPPGTGRYARSYLRRIRPALDGQLASDDLSTLDRLLDDENPDGVLRRHDLTVRGSRTVWAARRR